MPTGTMIPDGFASRVIFNNNINIGLFIKEPTPFGFEGGGKIEVTTNDVNTRFRTFRPKKLLTVTGGQFIAGFDPVFLTTLLTMLQANQLIDFKYEDGSKHSAWGWLESFKPSSRKEGDLPLATVMFEVSNLNGAGAETPPFYTAGP